jgi:lysine 2,3-aminomutase
MITAHDLRSEFTRERFCGEADGLLVSVRRCRDRESARRRLVGLINEDQYESGGAPDLAAEERTALRDCTRALRGMLRERSDERAGFSVTQALWDLARGVPRPDLQPGFFAELIHLVRGIEGRAETAPVTDLRTPSGATGRPAAELRSAALDALWAHIEPIMRRYAHGLSDEAVARRAARRERVLAGLGGRPEDWDDWRWHVRHILRDPEDVARLARLTAEERACVRAAWEGRVPFGITPYYLSLMDDDPEAGRDRAIRAQVLPPPDYVREMAAHRGERDRAFDFMLERDTSPIDLVTRRYPGIVILKPFNTCPQICVYCQRNWEIDDAMAPCALASPEAIEAACAWIERHTAVHEVLVTGGDTFGMDDADVERVLGRLARIGHVDLIRIGTRTPVTLPMRITPALADLLGRLREPGRREVCVVTHVEHAYEITPELVQAIDRLRRAGVAVYNQHVYTFHVSRRFEAARLRMLLRRAGIDPYYTFVPKGKDETAAYRVPFARILQEQKEEARLLPGLRRTDEAVYNVPGLGKNYVRAVQHRDLISVLPDGARVYEFHPWEKAVARQDTYVGTEVPILDYLERLAAMGEDPADYASIWYYF